MKKQITAVLLVLVFLSANLFAAASKGASDGLEDKVRQQVENRDPHAEEEWDEDDSDEDEEILDVEDYKESLRQIDSESDSQQETEPSALVRDMQIHTGNNQQLSEEDKKAWELKFAEFDQKRSELEDYVFDSYWITWKFKSIGDVELTVALLRLGFKGIELVSRALGSGTIAADNISNFLAGEIQENKGGPKDPIRKKHDIDVLYVKVQRNAFNLLHINKDDYFKLIEAYPEVDILFNDMYLFFKWRAHMREYYKNAKHNEYLYNEYLIYREFKRAVRRNSFEGWWALSKIAKKEIDKSIAGNNSCLSSKTAKEERDTIKKQGYPADNAVEAGRKWNGMQRYAAYKGALPFKLNPTLGAGTPEMQSYVKGVMKPFSKRGMAEEFKKFREAYIKGRFPKDAVAAIEEQSGENKQPDENKMFRLILQKEQESVAYSAKIDSYTCAPASEEEIGDQPGVVDPIKEKGSLLDELAAALLKAAD